MEARRHRQRSQKGEVEAMTTKGAIDCRFYLEGEVFAERAWHALPGPNEIVMLPTNPPHDCKHAAFTINGRVFLGDGGKHNRQLVYFYIERLVQ